MQDDVPQLLLVEEDETLAEITAFRLELLGYGVRSAGTGDETQKKVHQQRPDLIILDTVLPDVDGIELVNSLKNDPATHDIPILIFSADADLDSVEKAFAAGADDYLVTPYDPAVLEQKLEHLLETTAVAK